MDQANFVIQNYLNSLASYIDLLRQHFIVQYPHQINIKSYQTDANYQYFVTIEILPSLYLSPYLSGNHNQLEQYLISLFNYNGFDLIDLHVVINEHVIMIHFTFKEIPELPLEIINQQMVKYLNYDQLQALCLSNKKLNTYCSDYGWKQFFIIKYPEIYQKVKLYLDQERSNDQYKEILKLINMANSNINNLVEYIKYAEVMIYLVEQLNIDPADNNNKAIRWAAENGHLEVVKYLISLPPEYNIDPAADDNAAIRLAAEYGKLEVVKYFNSLGYY